MRCSICGGPLDVLPVPGAATYCGDCYQDAYPSDDPKGSIYADMPSYDLPDPEPRLGLDV